MEQEMKELVEQRNPRRSNNVRRYQNPAWVK